MEIGGLKSVSRRSIEQLELLAAQLAQLDEVLLHLVATQDRRVDRSVVKNAAQTLGDTRIARAPRLEKNHMIAEDFLFELVFQRFHSLGRVVALRLNALPLVLVAVKCLDYEVQVVFAQLALVLDERSIDRLQLARQLLVGLHVLQTSDLAFVHLVQQVAIVRRQLLHVGLLVEQDVGLHSLEVVDHEALLVELGQLVEQLCQLVEALLGR